MAESAVQSRPAYGALLSRARLQIQKPEISTYRPAAAAHDKIRVNLVWTLLIALTYLFSALSLYFVFSV